MPYVGTRLYKAVSENARAWLGGAFEALEEKGTGHAAVLLPQLPRKFGRDAIGGGRLEQHGVIVDLGAWRACDVAGAMVIDAAEADDDTLVDWYQHGDSEERTIVMRSLALRPISAATVTLTDIPAKTAVTTGPLRARNRPASRPPRRQASGRPAARLAG